MPDRDEIRGGQWTDEEDQELARQREEQQERDRAAQETVEQKEKDKD